MFAGGMNMKITVPDYYLKFKCIADRCTDSCCIGWEIDIDDESRAKYAALDSEIGAEIREKTQHGVFPLQKNGRCAFLDERGLCRIISAHGDGYLCDICREHPRYYGVGAEGLDGGLGLACPEAARIILSVDERPKFVTTDATPRYDSEDDYADVSRELRELVYETVYSRDVMVARALFPALAEHADEVVFDATAGLDTEAKSIATIADTNITEEYLDELIDLFSEREALNEEWSERLTLSRSIKPSALTQMIEERASEYRALLFYFTHRYLRECVEDMSAMGRVMLARYAADVIFLLSGTYESSEGLVKSAVLFSKNIEYSTENIDMLTDALTDEI